MSMKSKVIAAAATVTLIGGVGAVATFSASAATPSCGRDCLDLLSREFGTHTTPNYVQDVLRQGATVGQPIIFFRTSNSDPAEDFTVSFQGSTSDFYAADLVSSAVALHYGCVTIADGGPFTTCANGVDDPAFETEYAPYGVDSGLCVGVPTTAVEGTEVSLQPCGITAKTVWVQDIDNATGFADSYAPYINGSDTNFSHPYVLDYPHAGFPTDSPRPQLFVNTLELNAHHDIVQDTQEWSENFGILR